MKDSKVSFKNIKVLLAIILILLGISLLSQDSVVFNFIWQIAVLIWGLFLFREKNYLQGGIVTAFGIVCLYDTIFDKGFTTYLAGILVIVVGIKIFFDEING